MEAAIRGGSSDQSWSVGSVSFPDHTKKMVPEIDNAKVIGASNGGFSIRWPSHDAASGKKSQKPLGKYQAFMMAQTSLYDGDRQ